jgi:hypothetical protein
VVHPYLSLRATLFSRTVQARAARTSYSLELVEPAEVVRQVRFLPPNRTIVGIRPEPYFVTQRERKTARGT